VLPKRLPFFYGWVIVFVSLVSLLLEWGARSSFSVFYVAILKEFGWSRASTALIYSLFIFNYGLISPLSGVLIDKFGPRKTISAGAFILALGAFACSKASQVWHLYIFWGLIGAAGISISAFVPHTVVISRWFLKRRGMALGIISSGTGLGSLLTFFVQYLIELFGWRTAYVIMGAAILVVIVPLAAFFQRSRPEDMGLLPDGAERNTDTIAVIKMDTSAYPLLGEKQSIYHEWTLLKATKDSSFWALFSCLFCFNGVAIGFLLAHQVAFVIDIGHTATFAALIFGIFGITQFIGQSFGFITDRIGREKGYTLACLLSFLGVLCIFSVKDTMRPWLLYSYGILTGLGTGLMLPAVSGAAADLFQGRHFGSIYGLITFGFGMGGAMSSWLGGYIFDAFGGYKIAFIISMLGLCAACWSMWVAAPRRIKRRV
jgi:MFS family permease